MVALVISGDAGLAVPVLVAAAWASVNAAWVASEGVHSLLGTAAGRVETGPSWPTTSAAGAGPAAGVGVMAGEAGAAVASDVGSVMA